MDKLLDIFTTIKEDFCSLTTYKVRGESLEIITPFSTLNNKFVSVFIKEIKGKFVISDGGWTDLNYYDVNISEESEDIIQRIFTYYQQSFEISITSDQAGTLYYFKTCSNPRDIPTYVYDIANFIVGAVNSLGIKYKDDKEEKEKETFRKDANTFLKVHYDENVKLQKSLDDFKNIRFNALITKNSDIFLISYVTGSSSYYFTNDLRKTIVNFEISEKSKYRDFIREKVSIINDNADGYRPDKLGSMLELLNEKVTKEPIKWSEKEKILELI
ncbi:hypothetical protein [Leeuwenhoekiella blandensis]|uniref:DUF1828 domain-containing protein n=1 Tax=Leeuwenhoekiella blandensis (strain CECT 7118 / CCUG 51940 / KCTC 22103 / MED217) TaxID=398720 RepID=A3XLH7_LEEBM|nr:hypothetical protein [Leeuwenhoekiella blandensis]EAQ49593.1 hypothetical protein MED217_12079 [Leeuwenhoekiella blandensis MED217]